MASCPVNLPSQSIQAFGKGLRAGFAANQDDKFTGRTRF